MTAEDLQDLPDDEQRYELVAGVLVSEPPVQRAHARVLTRITFLLESFVRARGFGTLYAGDLGFILARSPDTVRAPDLAFISSEREEALGTEPGFVPGAPDLAVEILSPSNRRDEVRVKVAEYLAAGARAVWVVDPEMERVTVYRCLLSPRVFTRNENIEGDDVLPGFKVKVSELFDTGHAGRAADYSGPPLECP